MTRTDVIKKMCQITSKVANFLRKNGDYTCYCNANSVLRGDQDDFKFDPDILEFVNEAVTEKIQTTEYGMFDRIINSFGAVGPKTEESIHRVSTRLVDILDRFFQNSSIDDQEEARRIVELLILEHLGTRLGEKRIIRASKKARNP